MTNDQSPIDDYLSKLSDEQRRALETVRQSILAAAPGATEYIGYGLAAFRLDGKPLVAIGASPKHCGFYPMSNKTVARCKEWLQGYQTSTGTIRFSPDNPLPEALVRRLVQDRIEENKRGTAGKASIAKTPKVKSAGNPKSPAKDKAAAKSVRTAKKAGNANRTKSGGKRPANKKVSAKAVKSAPAAAAKALVPKNQPAKPKPKSGK